MFIDHTTSLVYINCTTDMADHVDIYINTPVLCEWWELSPTAIIIVLTPVWELQLLSESSSHCSQTI